MNIIENMNKCLHFVVLLTILGWIKSKFIMHRQEHHFHIYNNYLIESILLKSSIIVIRIRWNSDECHLRTIEQISSFLLLLGSRNESPYLWIYRKSVHSENIFPSTYSDHRKIGNAWCCNPNFFLTFIMRETLQRWLVKIVILQVVKLLCQLPWFEKLIECPWNINDLDWKKLQLALDNFANCNFASCQITLSITLITLSNYVL